MRNIDYVAEMGRRIEAKLVAGTDLTWNELVAEASAELKVEESLRE